MRRFLIKIIFLLIPIILFIFIYLIIDPFKVIYHYDDYRFSNQPEYINLNRGYVSLQNFKNQLNNIEYDSFILGSSRSMFFQVNEWKKYIGNRHNCYHFDANGDNIYGMYAKLNYISKSVDSIKHCLFIIDIESWQSNGPKTTGSYHSIIPPELINYNNITGFHIACLKAFYSPSFIYDYLLFKLLNISGNSISKTEIKYDNKTNEVQYQKRDSLIENNYRKIYTEEWINKYFKNRNPITYQPLSDDNLILLQKICEIFKRNNTNYKIIISPLWNQQALLEQDLNNLYKIFGSDNVYNFSGKNMFTDDFLNYYESSHYRPNVCNQILEIIYKNEQKY